MGRFQAMLEQEATVNLREFIFYDILCGGRQN